MSDLYVMIAVIGALVLVLGLLSSPIHNRSLLSDPLVALLVGVVLGPAGFRVLDPSTWGSLDLIVEEAARLTLAIGLMAIALRLPRTYVVHNRRALGVLVGLVMPLMWLSSSLLVYLLLPLPLPVALLVGAIVTPTDPVVASSLLTSQSAKEYLPARTRHALSAESGANDGLAVLLVMLPILLITRSPDQAVAHWLTHTLLWDVFGAILVGTIVGYGAGWLLQRAEEHELLEEAGFLSYTVALALATVGVVRLIGMDEILAVFVAGVAFDHVVGGRERAQEASIQETVNRFFSIPIFTLLGLVLPIGAWLQLGWSAVVLAGAILLLRRLPAMLALHRWIAPIRALPDALFTGWFGPIGISALLYAMVALKHTGDEAVWTVSSLVICASIVAHGVTATPLIRRYGMHLGKDSR